MGKKAPKVAVPDPVAIANAQSSANIKSADHQAALNRVGTSGPYGSTDWTQGPNGQWSQNTTLNPTEQAAYEQQMAARSSALGGATNSNINLGALPALQSQIADAGQIQRSVGADDFSADRQKVEDAMYARATSRLDPRFAQEQSALDARLANQGLSINSAAYGNASDQFGRTKNDAYALAQNDAILAGGQEQSRLFGMDLNQGQFANQAQAQQYGQNATSAQFTNDARAQGFNEQTTQDQLALQRLAAMSNPMWNTPDAIQYTPTAIAPTDVTGAYALQNQANQTNAQLKAQSNSSALNGMYQLGSAAMMAFSDVRLKRDIRRVGKRADGLGLYLFRYIWSPVVHLGVMAQEVLKVKPQAVHRTPEGWLMVDYGAL